MLISPTVAIVRIFLISGFPFPVFLFHFAALGDSCGGQVASQRTCHLLWLADKVTS